MHAPRLLMGSQGFRFVEATAYQDCWRVLQPNDEEPLPYLGHAVVGGVEDADQDGILQLTVWSSEPSDDIMQVRPILIACQAGNVLKQKRLRFERRDD